MRGKREGFGKNNIGLNTGSSSILVIFMVLCLVTLASLSMISAVSDYKLSRKVADRTTAYYEAVNKAEEKLAAIDTAASKGTEVDYTVPIDDSQQLCVSVAVNQDGSSYSVREWKVENTKKWEADDTLKLITE